MPVDTGIGPTHEPARSITSTRPMKSRILNAILSLVVAATPAMAKGKAKTKQKSSGHGGHGLAHFDKNHNGAIDGAEIQAVRKAASALAALDTNKDGSLSDEEIAAASSGLKAGKKQHGKAGKAKKGKKGAKAAKHGKAGKGGKGKKHAGKDGKNKKKD